MSGSPAACGQALNGSEFAAMKAWQIFVVGVTLLVAALLFRSYERILAGVAASLMVAVVVAGFLFRPRKAVFYLRTTLLLSEPDFPLSVEHDRLAIGVELARLWLLFLPTFAAVAFFIVTSASGRAWDFSLLDWFGEHGSYPVYLGIRVFQIMVVGLLSTWVSERWVLRDAEACSADYISTKTGYLLYSFKDRLGEYYGGEGFPFVLVRPPRLAQIVFYRASNPQLNKIGMALLFHRIVIIGRGLTDLDEATVKVHSVKARPAPQTL